MTNDDDQFSDSPPKQNFVEKTKTIVRRIRGFSLKRGQPEPKAMPLEDNASPEFASSASSGTSPGPARPESHGELPRESKIESTISGLKRVRLLNFAEWITSTVQNRGYAFYGNLITIVLCSYYLADVLAIVAGRFIPEPPAVHGSRWGASHRQKTIEDYNVIFARNLFNRQGIIPGEDSGIADPGGAPIKTTLPFNLIGTLILRDELRSIATIEDKTASMVYPVRIDEEIPGKARIVKIEPRRVIFVNSASGRREYVELPEEATSNAKISVPATAGSGIEQSAAGQFNIARAEVDKAMADFNNILTQARAVPNFENGAPAGYKLFQIVPGSIYEKLGLKNGDVITGFDGSPINDPAKAFEMLGKLKEGASHMEMQVKRDGKPSTFTYDFH